MNLSDITIICPTKGRPQLATNLLNSIDHRPFIFVVNEGARYDAPADLRGAQALYGPKGVGPAAQFGILACQTKLFVQTCDDVQVEPGWLEEALRVYNEKFGDGDGVVSINNCHPPDKDLATFPLMSKRFFMDLMHPVPYEHYYIDTEWTTKAVALGCYAYAEKAIMRHCQAGPQDDGEMKRDRVKFEQRIRDFLTTDSQSSSSPTQPTALVSA